MIVSYGVALDAIRAVLTQNETTSNSLCAERVHAGNIEGAKARAAEAQQAAALDNILLADDSARRERAVKVVILALEEAIDILKGGE